MLHLFPVINSRSIRLSVLFGYCAHRARQANRFKVLQMVDCDWVNSKDQLKVEYESVEIVYIGFKAGVEGIGLGGCFAERTRGALAMSPRFC